MNDKLTPESFCYWMQGFVELTEGQRPSDKQWEAIAAHLQQVFKKTVQHSLQIPTPVPMPTFGPTFRDSLQQPTPLTTAIC